MTEEMCPVEGRTVLWEEGLREGRMVLWEEGLRGRRGLGKYGRGWNQTDPGNLCFGVVYY